MALKHEIQEQLMTAMKAKETVRVSTLRMLKAAILKFEVEGERKEAGDEDIMKIIQREIKSRRDSVEQFQAGNRFDLAENEEKEIAVLMEFMPPQMTEEEITALAKEVIKETGAKSRADMGRIMGALMPKVQGQADGTLVSKVVNGLLG
ncbi:GatB/YqeY domain-containing protein [Patescibacteria group bacterium]|nr:GatB/YqeY domain-containing protein [Patescibacteria group bacterium]MBU1703430.1 GatB/YqeY domain-containing protein [Patescibacteria group bacterium]MBU1953631.1 GatB/YqeY domain-containing protein [Patescibacteria group bacterium]